MNSELTGAKRAYDPVRLCTAEQVLLDRVAREGSVHWLDVTRAETDYLNRLVERGLIRADEFTWVKL